MKLACVIELRIINEKGPHIQSVQSVKIPAAKLRVERQTSPLGRHCRMGRGAGDSITADILYCIKLVENYSLPLQKFPSKENGTTHPWTCSLLRI